MLALAATSLGDIVRIQGRTYEVAIGPLQPFLVTILRPLALRVAVEGMGQFDSTVVRTGSDVRDTTVERRAAIDNHSCGNNSLFYLGHFVYDIYKVE